MRADHGKRFIGRDWLNTIRKTSPLVNRANVPCIGLSGWGISASRQKTKRRDKQVNNFMVVSAREQICGYAQDLTMAKTMAYELSKENPGVKYTVFVAKDSFMEIPKIYKLGQRFLSQNGNGSEYLLANTEPNKVNLINLKTGRRLSTSVVVDNTDEISENEFRKLVGNLYDEFQEI
jgi:cellobiose phosphorylase